MAEDRIFEIGFVMAGAISAGAYTAGVMDFMVEALDAYEEAKNKSGWTGPTHNVRVPVLAGASAGGMTSALCALHAFRDLEHVWPGKPRPRPQRNRLYSSWVTDVSIERLLELTDLAGANREQGVMSLLCCDVLDEIVANAFDIEGALKVRNWIGRGTDHRLRVFLTLTNVRGVPYSFPLFGAEADERYGMLNHADYGGFSVGPSSDFIDATPLDVRNFGGPNWPTFKTMALATGAFPVGLRPRLIQRDSAGWYHNAQCVGYEDWRGSQGAFVSIAPDSSFGAEAPYRFMAVDGGTINNEPLELARRYLADADAGHPHNDQDGDKANRAVVLVAPFPNYRAAPPPDEAMKLIHVFPRTGFALQDQARLKPEELALAANDKVFSRFMICPIRAGAGGVDGKLAIASGSLNGFGGFLHQSFRRHDYLLGRRNAQAFLHWNFGLPKTNPLFDGAAIDESRWQVRDADRAKGTLTLAKSLALQPKMFAPDAAAPAATPGYPIIPLVDRLCAPIEIGADDMPQPDAISLDDLKDRIGKRAEAVIDTLVDVDFKDLLENSILGDLEKLGAKRFGKIVATKKAFDIVGKATEEVKNSFG